MIRYAALLRGIAPSGHNMTNHKSRGVFERLGFEQVQSVLSSGNIVFSADHEQVPVLEERIELALAEDLGIASRTIIRTYSELRALTDGDPFAGQTHGTGNYLTVTFIKDAAFGRARPETPAPLTEIVRYDEAARAILAVTDNRTPGATPNFMAWVEKAYGGAITTRSWPSVMRILRKLES
ncbi:MAG: DUF1697 domain-containing protein [Brooklawnia sp.]|uniref:DUF1697 domain-containing protein n=1 Tax=Brooklawnia sp. TaxID=2699740 RepID=UPI003C753ACA